MDAARTQIQIAMLEVDSLVTAVSSARMISHWVRRRMMAASTHQHQIAWLRIKPRELIASTSARTIWLWAQKTMAAESQIQIATLRIKPREASAISAITIWLWARKTMAAESQIQTATLRIKPREVSATSARMITSHWVRRMMAASTRQHQIAAMAADQAEGSKCYFCKNNKPLGAANDGCVNPSTPNCMAADKAEGTKCYFCKNNMALGTNDDGCGITDPNCDAENQRGPWAAHPDWFII